MEIFVVLVCCAIAAALGFFIGAAVRTRSLIFIRSELRESTVRNGTSYYVLRDGTEITFDWSDSVVTIERGES